MMDPYRESRAQTITRQAARLARRVLADRGSIASASV